MSAKKTTSILLYVCCALILTACAHSQLQKSPSPSLPLDGFTGTTIEVSKTIVVKNGQTFDGHGKYYQWVGAGDCSQSEGMPPMFDLHQGATLKNLWMENAPDGIHIKGSNVVIDSIVNIDVCEDAISISRPKPHQAIHHDISITNSRFYHCQDKAIQLTRGANVLIKNNEFYNCAKAVRVKEQAHDIHFENNRIFSAKQAIKVTGGTIMVKDNYIKGTRTALWAEKNGLIIDKGGNTLVNLELAKKETEGGKVVQEIGD